MSRELNNDPDKKPTKIQPVSIGSLVEANPEMRPPVVSGILRRGETANIIAAAKVGKSHMAGGLAWCIATGTPWLSHDVVQGKVLIIDNELHPETLATRLHRIATEMQIHFQEYADSIDVICLRGQNIDIHALEHRLDSIEYGTYSLVILDALYRTLPLGTSENDNGQMMAIYNKLDHYTATWGSAIGVVHHASKGQQGDKAVTDVGAGAGSISRAADTHIVIRPHENPDLSVLEYVTRSFKSPPAVSIRFDWPIWNAVTASPEVKKATRQNQDAQAKADKEATAEILSKIPADKAIQQKKLFEQLGHGENKCRRLVGLLVSQKRVVIERKRKKGLTRPMVFYRQTTPEVTPEVTPV